MKKNIAIAIVILCGFAYYSGNAQIKDTKEVSVSSAKKTSGVSVSPAHFHLNLKPGQSKTYSVTINNDTPKAKSFGAKMLDFNMNGKGQSSFLPAGTGKYSLSKWASVSPTFLELKPFEKKKVNFTVTVPSGEEGIKAAWSILMIEQQEERFELTTKTKKGKSMAMGVIPTFAFGVFVYQNPPNVALNDVQFIDFVFNETSENKTISIVAENKGDGISYCTAYIDLTNLKTGEQQRLKVKKFTIVPELIRDFIFKVPGDLPKGEYIAVGVLDFENSEEIQAAKMELSIN